MKVVDVLKQLKRNGFLELKDRQVGDHHRYTDNKGHKVTVKYASKKASVPPKTYNAILKQAGLK
ncbi:MAG TPA: toxin HicA [Lactobacillus sp.]|nr:toxin HicA [Lactobacillus sp.]